MTPDKLKQWRATRGLSQSQLAALLPCSVVALASWENGRRAIPPLLPRALNDVDRELKADK